MILKDDAFDDLENFVDNSWREIEYIVVHFDISKDKTKVLKYFAPIFTDESVSKKDLSKIFYYFLGFVVYDKNKFTQNKSDIFSIVKEVISRRLSEENSKRVISYIEDIDYKNYDTFQRDSEASFIPILSDALHGVKIINSLESKFIKYDIHFLTKKQKIDIIKKSEEFDAELFKDVPKKDKDLYLENLFNPKKYEFLISHEASKNIRKDLKSLKLTEILDSFFFEYEDEIQSLIFTKNFFTDSLKNKIFSIICDSLDINFENSIHKNAPLYYQEIVREIKFINLYEIEDTYVIDYNRNSHLLDKLYEKMNQDKLSTLKFYVNDEHKYFQSLCEAFAKTKNNQRDDINKDVYHALINHLKMITDNNIYENLGVKNNLNGFKTFIYELLFDSQNVGNSYASKQLNNAMNISSEVADMIQEEIESRARNYFDYDEVMADDDVFDYERNNIKSTIEDNYLDIEDFKSEKIINSLDSDEYKPLTKREKERLKQRKKRALQNRAKEKTFNYEERAKELSKSKSPMQKFNIKINNKATD